MEGAHVLRGEKNGRVYRLGDRLKVQVIRVDLERRQIDLGVSEILDTVRASDEGRGRRPRTVRTKSGTGRERRGRPGRRERAHRKGGGRRGR
jgi:ribonuclease R